MLQALLSLLLFVRRKDAWFLVGGTLMWPKGAAVLSSVSVTPSAMPAPRALVPKVKLPSHRMEGKSLLSSMGQDISVSHKFPLKSEKKVFCPHDLIGV